MTPIIGIAGKARSGKDTVANLIHGFRGGYKYSFADPIKRMTDTFIERGGDNEKEVEIPELGKSRRYLWQTLGTEWGRKIVNPDIWLTVARWAYQKGGEGMIVTDVRFENEADWIRSEGGRILHVSRPEAPTVGGSADHASEKGIEKKYSDIDIWNGGSTDKLCEYVLTVLKQLGDVDA